MRLTRRLLLGVCLILATLGAANAAPATPDWLKEPLKKPLSEVTIGMAAFATGLNSYNTSYFDAFKAYSKELGIKTIIFDARVDPQTQASQIQNLIAQKVDSLIVWPVNGTAVIPSLAKASAAGIPVVITNSRVPEPGAKYITTYTGPNSYKEAGASAEMMGKALNGKGNVVMINGLPGYSVSNERINGFLDVLKKKYPDIKVLDSQPGDWSREKGQSVMENFITRFGDKINGVYTADGGSMGLGAMSAYDAAVSEGKLKANSIQFVDCTANGVVYDAVKAGKYYGTVLQPSSEDAKIAVKAAVMIAEGLAVPKEMNFETPAVTKENADQYPRPAY